MMLETFAAQFETIGVEYRFFKGGKQINNATK